MSKLISYLSKIVSYIIPISQRLLVFTSFPDYTDNSYAIYRYLIGKYPQKYRYVWLVSDKNCKRDNVNMVYRFSLRGIWLYYRAKYIFCTHGINAALKLHNDNKIVNMWHGMPLKSIGALDSRYNGYNPTNGDYLIATSPFFQRLMSRAFNDKDLKCIPIVGQPRNDLLFESTSFFEDNLIDVKQYNQIGIWLPTYRSSIVGETRIDGNYKEGAISFLTEDELEKLNEYLYKTRTLILIKLHPMDALQNYSFRNYTNIILLKQKKFKWQLYPLVGNCDFLLTDYSSVWLDYEILNKPIGFVMNDIEEYKNSRGLTIQNLDDHLPGQILDTLDKLIKFIENPTEKLIERNNFFNSYKDKKSCERLADFLNL